MRSFLQFLAFFLLLVFIGSLAVLAQYQTEYPKTVGPALNNLVRSIHQEKITDQQPSVVLMGDSTLKLSVDFERLAASLGTETYGIPIPGSSSALWYLITKNNIAESDYKPDFLVIFFRESMLTTANYRVDGRYFPTINEFASPEDELLIQYSYLYQSGMLGRIAERYLPLYGDREKVHSSINYRINHTLPLLAFNCDAACVTEALHNVFVAELNAAALNLEQDMVEGYLWRAENLLFRRQLERSYLDEMVRITRENDIQLVLVEVKTLVRPHSSNTMLMRRMYFQALQEYAQQNQVEIIRFGDDPRILPSYYFDNFHMHEFAKPIFTDILAEELKPLIEAQQNE